MLVTQSDGEPNVTIEQDAVTPVTAGTQPAIGESRWPPVVALLSYLILNVAMRVWLPSGSPVRVPWLIPAVEGVLLLALVASDHSNVATRRRWLRPVCLALVLLLVAAALWATILLLHDLIVGA